MRKKIKVSLYTAGSLILLGGAIFTFTACSVDWKMKNLDERYETNEYEITESFNAIAINSDTADINFAVSEDGNAKAVFKEKYSEKHTVSVKNDTLTVNLVDEDKWYDNLFLNFSPKITIYLPQTEYTSLTVKESTGDITIPKEFAFERVDLSLSTGDVKSYASASESMKIKTSTGDILVGNTSAATLDISVTTGDIKIENVTCKTLNSVGNTGELTLTNVVVEEKLSILRSTGDVELQGCDAGEIYIKTSTGDVELQGCDAGEIYIKTSTGDVKGSLLSEKIFITDSNTGDVKVPESLTGGKCKIETDTGDIKITLP